MQTCNRCSGQEIDHCWLSSRSPPLPSAPFWWQYLRSYAALLFPLNWFKRNHTLWIILCLASFTQHYICFPSGWTNLMYIICDRNPVSFLSTWISSCLSTVRWKDNLFFTIFICHLVRNHWSIQKFQQDEKDFRWGVIWVDLWRFKIKKEEET